MSARLLAVWMLSVAATAISGRAVLAMAQRRRRPDAGSTTLEFTLAFPVFLVSVFASIQTSLLMGAQVIVDYAAFAASRSASVWVGDLEEKEVTIKPDTTDEAQKRVLRAAVLACVPISPKLSQLSVLGLPNPLSALDAELNDVLTQATANLGATGGAIANLTLDTTERWPYSSEYTTVTLSADSAACVDQPITVTVEHRFRMAVPFVGPMLASGLGGGRLLGDLGDFYVPVRASHSMRRWACQPEA